MYRNFAYILSLIPQYQLHEVDSIFTSFFKNKKIGFKMVSGLPKVTKKQQTEDEAEQLASELKYNTSSFSAMSIQGSPKWETKSTNQLTFGVPASASVSDQSVNSLMAETVPYPCFISSTWHCMKFNKAHAS